MFINITKILAVLYFAVLIGFGNSACPDCKELGSVILSHVIFRHGARAPKELCPKDPYKYPRYWPDGRSHLTQIGMRQLLELGEWMRMHYSQDLLFNITKWDDVMYVQSSGSDRTLSSARKIMDGFFYPDAPPQAIQIHSELPTDDEIVAAAKPCRSYNFELARVLEIPALRCVDKQNQALYRYITLHCGLVINNLTSLASLYNAFFIENEFNMHLPEWTEVVFPEMQRFETLYTQFIIPVFTRKMQRLKSGPLLREIVDHMTLKRQGILKPEYKMYLYSAHDMTISNLLNTLQVFDLHWPPYASMVLIELRKRTCGKEYLVTVSYKNSTDPPVMLTLPGCCTACPLDCFIQLSEPVLPIDWEEECNNLTISAMEGEETNFQHIPKYWRKCFLSEDP